jgi:hypothetical protein
VTRDELEHAIRAACDVSGDDAVYVFGSQAILGSYPNAPAELRQSIEADVCPQTRRSKITAIDGSLGEFSPFHKEFGFYVHGVSLSTAKLPRNWRSRVVRVKDAVGTRGKTGLCLEGHDLAASKLAAFREKDTDFVRVLLKERLIRPTTLTARIRTLPIAGELRERLIIWVKATSEGLATG